MQLSNLIVLYAINDYATNTMKKKTERVEFRMTPETKTVWLQLCEWLPGNTQSQAFRNLIIKVSDENKLKTILIQDDNE